MNVSLGRQASNQLLATYRASGRAQHCHWVGLRGGSNFHSSQFLGHMALTNCAEACVILKKMGLGSSIFQHPSTAAS
jgi:hypothetical protein